MIFINSSPKNALKIFQPFLPIFVPVGIGFLISALKQKGIEVQFVDEQIEEDLLNKIKKMTEKLQKPYIFGFSVITSAFKNAIKLSKDVKKAYPDSIIIFGGIHPTASADEVLNFEHIDLVVRGEGEIVLPELYKRIKNNESYLDLQNLSYKVEGKIVHNPRGDIIRNLDEIPAFPYQAFADKKKYDLGFIMSSRGCPYKCIFCSNRVTTDRGYRYRCAESIVDELELLHDKFGKKYVLFLDDNFLVNKKRIYTLTTAIKEKNLHNKMTFNFQARGDNVSEELLAELYSAGFRSIFFGIEASSNRILEIVKKGETIEEIVDAVKMSKRIGYYVSATFIFALPTETHEDRMNCVELSQQLELDMVRFNNATPYPGTELYTMAKNENRLHIKGMYENFNSVSTFIESPFDKIPFSYVPPGSIEDEIRKDILFCYIKFYFNFGRLKMIFTRPDLGAGWFNAGEGFMEVLKKIPAIILLFFMMGIKFSELFISILFQYKTTITRKELFSVFKNFFKQKRNIPKV